MHHTVEIIASFHFRTTNVSFNENKCSIPWKQTNPKNGNKYTIPREQMHCSTETNDSSRGSKCISLWKLTLHSTENKRTLPSYLVIPVVDHWGEYGGGGMEVGGRKQ